MGGFGLHGMISCRLPLPPVTLTLGRRQRGASPWSKASRIIAGRTSEECVFDRSMLSHKVNLFDMHHKYGDVMHVDDIIEHLQTRDTLKKAV